MNAIAANLARIREQIDTACHSCGRDPREVRLVAVSKKKPADAIEAACAAGQKLFGESYVQEFCAKSDAMDLPIDWHFIGSLQSNKVKQLRGRTSLIHSVDRLSLAREISRQWSRIDACADILLQFNLGGEASKSGADAAQALELARAVDALPHLRIRGLMCLPPYHPEPEEVRPYFRRLRQLREQLQAALPQLRLTELSMGMSHDFQVAIEEGATLVRVGTAIFGSRD